MRTWQTVLAAAVLGSSACSGGSSNGPANSLDIAGEWTYLDTLASAALQLSCKDQGTLQISQTGGNLTAAANQSGVCQIAGSPVDNGGSGTAQGTTSGTAIAFTVGSCRYAGTLYNTPPDSAAGSESCDVPTNGGTTAVLGSWLAVKGLDLAPPTASGSVTFPAGDTLFVPGDTFKLQVLASDDRRVRWAGYRLGPPVGGQDSVAGSAAGFSGTFSRAVTAAWTGSVTVTVFARDALGRLTEGALNGVTVLDAVRRPTQTLPLDAYTSDLAYDAKRDALYLLQLGAGRVGVLALGSFTLGTPIALPGAPTSSIGGEMDLTPGNDTLVVPLATPAIAFIDLVSGAIDTVHITSDVGTTTSVHGVHVTANRQAFVFGEWSTGGTGGDALYQYSLDSGTTRRRTDIGIGGNIGGTTELAGSWDRTRLLRTEQETNCGQVYDAASDAFSACVSGVAGLFAEPTGTTSGDRWLDGGLVLDGSAHSVATLPAGDRLHRGAIAPDGSAVYEPTSYGYEKLALPGLAVLERVRLTVGVTRMTALPDGRRLILWTDPGSSSDLTETNRVTLVDVGAGLPAPRRHALAASLRAP